MKAILKYSSSHQHLALKCLAVADMCRIPVETVIAELWLHVQDEAAPDQERTQCGAMLTFMTYHILYRRLEIELHHFDDLQYGLAQNLPLYWY